ncbi:OmpA family protein [Pseudothauera rhizosphaerae]|uniref:OmpA family protein n=1 Tax=Pseudothauera rhizosphaerae TaxID=2565932 RepID=A0A4S4ASQ5_9RHOO|nr:OmpA family protein [Pseudothauera rhizosphaerae]THF61559.1 OmpA family protein [Pseudothauera rhizosphaerae]
MPNFRRLLCLALLPALLAACATPPHAPAAPAARGTEVKPRPAIDWAQVGAALTRDLGALPGVSLTPRDDGALKLAIPAAEGFATGEADLRAGLAGKLDRIAPVLQSQPLAAVHVIGHTDGMGSELFNLQLSIARAEAVMEHLRSRGIALLRLSADGRGEAEPVADNGTPEGRAANRRVELILRPLY